MDAERAVARALGSMTGLPAYLEVPSGAPDDFLTVEQTGGGQAGPGVSDVELDVDCWGASRLRAREIAASVESLVPELAGLPGLFGPQATNTYRMRDPDTGRARYVVQVSVRVCD